MDFEIGIRWMHTFRKLPIQIPMIKTSTCTASICVISMFDRLDERLSNLQGQVYEAYVKKSRLMLSSKNNVLL
jgi:hypothetical protein